MSANITSDAQIVLAKQSAWHKFGTIINDAFDAATAIRCANLGWTVELESTYLADGREVSSRKAVVRSDTKDILGTVSSSYGPVQNVEAFSFFDGVFGEDKARYETAGWLGKGERVWMLARLPGGFDILPGDTLGKYLLLTNSHDGSSPVTAIFTLIRVVCANTLGQALAARKAGEMIRVVHKSKAIDRLRLAGDLLGKAGVFYDECVNSFSALKKSVKPAVLQSYFVRALTNGERDSVDQLASLGRRRVERLTELSEVGLGADINGVRGTLWGGYNAVVEWVDHERSSEEGVEYFSAGRGAAVKGFAFDQAMAMASELN